MQWHRDTDRGWLQQVCSSEPSRLSGVQHQIRAARSSLNCLKRRYGIFPMCACVLAANRCQQFLTQVSILEAGTTAAGFFWQFSTFGIFHRHGDQKQISQAKCTESSARSASGRDAAGCTLRQLQIVGSGAFKMRCMALAFMCRGFRGCTPTITPVLPST